MYTCSPTVVKSSVKYFPQNLCHYPFARTANKQQALFPSGTWNTYSRRLCPQSTQSRLLIVFRSRANTCPFRSLTERGMTLCFATRDVFGRRCTRRFGGDRLHSGDGKQLWQFDEGCVENCIIQLKSRRGVFIADASHVWSSLDGMNRLTHSTSSSSSDTKHTSILHLFSFRNHSRVHSIFILLVHCFNLSVGLCKGANVSEYCLFGVHAL